MLLRLVRFVLGGGLAGMLLLTACREPQPEPPAVTPTAPLEIRLTPASPTPEAELQPTTYPGPDAEFSVPGGYPAPGDGAGPTEMVSAYPGPGTEQTQAPQPGDAPYPGPGAEPALVPQPGDAAYPPPGAEPTLPASTDIPYPGPGNEVTPPAATPADESVPATPAPPGRPAVTPAPVPTATPTLAGPQPTIALELLATDPATVKVASGKVQLVEFFAFWDGASRGMAPVVNQLKAEYGRQMNFVFLDIDNPATEPFKRDLRYRNKPHFFLLDEQGKVLIQWTGYVTDEQFRKAFEAALQ